jgi:hypothetical protein
MGSVPVGTTVSFDCFVAGQDVSGPYGTEDLWDALDSGGYIPDALVFTGSNSAVVPACPSAQFGTGSYPIAWTGGSGAQPRSGPSTGAAADAGVIADGTLVGVACETTGDTVTDSATFTSNLWDELSNGGYIPNVDLDTQVNGSTPGVPSCSSPAPAQPTTAPPTSGGGSGGATAGGGSSGSAAGASGGNAGSPSTTLPAHASDPCIPALGGGSETTHSYFLGTQTDFSRTESLYQLCEGFPFSGTHGYSTTMKCVALEAIIILDGSPPLNKQMDALCEATDVIDAVQSGQYLGVPGGWACDQFSDIFATGLGILAAGATSESGAAVEVGVNVYRAINASLHLVCGAIFDGGAQTWGYNNEVSHEQQIAKQVYADGMCLRERTVFGDVFWSAASC